MSYQSSGAGSGATSGNIKARTSARELMSLVSRVATGFETILKTEESALSLSQWAMLETLAQEGGTCRPSQLARKLGFSRQLIRQAAKKLMGLELITADVPDEGAKAVELTLTEAGRDTIDDIADAIDALADALAADQRGFDHAARTLKLLSIAIAAQAPDEDASHGGAAT